MMITPLSAISPTTSASRSCSPRAPAVVVVDWLLRPVVMSVREARHAGHDANERRRDQGEERCEAEQARIHAQVEHDRPRTRRQQRRKDLNQPGRRDSTPAAAPAIATIALSSIIWRSRSIRVAPSAVRIDISRRRASPRASVRFATLALAMRSTRPTSARNAAPCTAAFRSALEPARGDEPRVLVLTRIRRAPLRDQQIQRRPRLVDVRHRL